jgi:hypothetical protein
VSTNVAPTPSPENQLWGIYYTAARLGFGDAWAHPIIAEQAKQAQWLPEPRKHRHQFARKPSRSIHI